MNENRNVWALNGLTGGLIATVLLVVILIVLSIKGILVQQENATNFYDIKDENKIQMRSVDNSKHLVDVK